MEQELHRIQTAAITLILETKTAKELEEVKLQFLGRSGVLTLALKEMRKLPKDKRPQAGKVANEVKQIIENAINQAEENLSKTEKHTRLQLDVTEPGIKPALGHLHLITQAIDEITAIFGRIGFSRVRYPEVEFDWYAFEALNFPESHPARDEWETFFIKQPPDPKKGPVILTPHTSSGQVREMERVIKEEIKHPKNTLQESDNKEVNIKMLNIAKCYRRQSDVTHTPMFHQFEGLVVGKGIAITHLKGTLDYFVKSYFGKDRVSRIRPYHFQFTEPSFEVDVSCGVCLGTGKLPSGEICRLCKAGWLEIGGAGMVHPHVLTAGGINPKEFTGFAFGWGVERVLMMKEGIEIDDLRLLYSNKLDFLEQF